MKDKNIHLAASINCTACAACVSACPKQCITMQEDKEGFLQPKIDDKQCISCHKCEKVCPILNTPVISNDFETKAFAVINRDDEVRAHSSSGGVFFPLATWVIDQGGVVFGARWNDKWEVEHAYAEDIEGVKSFMRSKYVQSTIGDTLRQAKAFLDEGRWVLYSGTPCQIGGLKTYLGKEYDKLVTVDLICHGVPSPGVWRSYLKDYVGNDKILDINFRDKSKGWLGFQFFTTTTTTTTTTRRDNQTANPYFRGFLYNVYLRNSCYDCRFRHYHRNTDFTLADYWGVDEVCPEMHDNKGTSIVFVHSQKGMTMLNQLSSNLKILEQTKSKAILQNQGIEKNEQRPPTRDTYFKFFRLFGFKKSEFAISTTPFLKRIVRKTKRTISKIFQV